MTELKDLSWDEALKVVNFDESKMPDFVLPDVLLKNDGERVRNAWDWVNTRRPEIVKLYREKLYGQALRRPDRVRYEILSERRDALDGLAVRKEMRIYFEQNDGRIMYIDVLIYLPKTASGSAPVPGFVGLNFQGNHTTTTESDVGFSGDKSLRTDENRGCQANRWEFSEVIKRGYASVTACYTDFFPERYGGHKWNKGIFALLYNEQELSEIGKTHSTIGAWAWGLSRIYEALENIPEIDCTRLALHGHSRLGKTALWAGATDTRWRIVISNDSGSGGAALYKRCIGERPHHANSAVPYWYIENHKNYIGHEERFEFDQHFLISLIAPRTVCVASATEDIWADPKGEYLAAWHAGEVYRLFGAKTLESQEMPPPDTFITGPVSYHIRTGKHDQLLLDWRHYLEIADSVFRPVK